VEDVKTLDGLPGAMLAFPLPLPLPLPPGLVALQEGADEQTVVAPKVTVVLFNVTSGVEPGEIGLFQIVKPSAQTNPVGMKTTARMHKKSFNRMTASDVVSAFLPVAAAAMEG
jgi:hypothetical protein